MSRNGSSVVFLSAVPETDEMVKMGGYSQAGNLACLGIAEALYASGIGLEEVYGFVPLATYPRDRRLFWKGRTVELFPGVRDVLFTVVNIFPFRNWVRYLSVMIAAIRWSVKNLMRKRVFVVYNIFFPHVLFMRVLTWLLHVKLVVVVFEIGTVKGFERSIWHRLMRPNWLKHLGERSLGILDGRILITDAIARDFAKGKHYLRIDGGITKNVVSRLPELTVAGYGEFRMMFAGGLSAWNGIPLMLEYMKNNEDPSLRLWIAGGGELAQEVENAAAKDSRIEYKGLLPHSELFKLYANADALLNLRDDSDPVMQYHYPSKFLEMLAVGKPVIATDVAHTREAYGEHCFVMDGFSLEAFAAQVERIRGMSPEERCEFGRATREWMLANKTWKAQATLIGSYIEKHVLKVNEK